MKQVKEIPEGYYICPTIEKLYTLKKGKRSWKPDNITLDCSKKVYLHSHTTESYYELQLHKQTPVHILKNYIKLKLLYYKP